VSEDSLGHASRPHDIILPSYQYRYFRPTFAIVLATTITNILLSRVFPIPVTTNNNVQALLNAHRSYYYVLKVSVVFLIYIEITTIQLMFAIFAS
jgi:hypothetical protein